MKTTDKSKKKKLVFEDVPDERTLNALKDGTRLEWVPTWEGALQYAPADLKADRCLRIWHTFRSKTFGGRRIRIELKPHLLVYHGRQIQRRRVDFKFNHKGQLTCLRRSQLTMLCLMGFTITDRRHWVIDHISGNTLDDRPSNLQVITQRENSARSERFRMTRKMSNAESKRQCEERVAWMNERRLQLMAIHPDADMIDIEFELAVEMLERPL